MTLTTTGLGDLFEFGARNPENVQWEDGRSRMRSGSRVYRLEAAIETSIFSAIDQLIQTPTLLAKSVKLAAPSNHGVTGRVTSMAATILAEAEFIQR